MAIIQHGPENTHILIEHVEQNIETIYPRSTT